MKRLKIIAMSAGLALSGVVLAGNADQTAYDAAVQAAKAAQKQAAKAGGEWNTIDKLLKQAGGAAEKGDFEKAIKFANTAKSHAELGLAQAEHEAKAWRGAVVK